MKICLTFFTQRPFFIKEKKSQVSVEYKFSSTRLTKTLKGLNLLILYMAVSNFEGQLGHNSKDEINSFF